MSALWRKIAKQETKICINICFHRTIFTMSNWTPSILTGQICTRTTPTLPPAPLLLRVFAPTVSPTAISGALPADSPSAIFFSFAFILPLYTEKKSPMHIMIIWLRLWSCWMGRYCYIICQWSDELQLTNFIRNRHKLLFKNSLQESLQLQLLPIIICKLWQLHAAFSTYRSLSKQSVNLKWLAAAPQSLEHL